MICIGAANSLANPKRLLRSVPPALYEIGTALVVAVTVLPAVRRQRAPGPGARRPAGGDTGRVGRLRRILVPVLEDALERSLAPGRRHGHARLRPQRRRRPRGQRRLTGALMLVGLCGICVGAYAVLDQTAPPTPGRADAGWLGVVVAVGGHRQRRPRVHRSRYRPDRWRWPELVVVASGVVVAVAGYRVTQASPAIAYPPLTPSRARACGPRGRRGRPCSPACWRRRRAQAIGGGGVIELRDITFRTTTGRAATASTSTIDEGELVAGVRADRRSASRRCSAW